MGIKDILLCVGIFLSGLLVGNANAFISTEPISTSKKDSVDKIETIIKIAEVKNIVNENVDENSVHKKAIVKQKQNKKSIHIYSHLEMFQKHLNALQYQEALELYENYSTDDNMGQYHAYFYAFVENLISKNDSDSLTLINQFLEIEPNNNHALYIQSQIYFQNDNYKNAISTLKHLKLYDLETSLERKVHYTLDEYTATYINVLQNSGNPDRLISFLQNTIADSSKAQYYYILGKIYFDQGRNDEAKEILEQILHDNKYKSNINKILAKIDPPKKSTIEIKLEKLGGQFYVKVHLNNDTYAKLLLDTGASITTIHNSIMDSLEHKVIKDEITLLTASGTLMAKLIQINSFKIDNTEVKNMNIVSSTHKQDGFDGLLGMNYLKVFEFYIDQKESILHLKRK